MEIKASVFVLWRIELLRAEETSIVRKRLATSKRDFLNITVVRIPLQLQKPVPVQLANHYSRSHDEIDL